MTDLANTEIAKPDIFFHTEGQFNVVDQDRFGKQGRYIVDTSQSHPQDSNPLWEASLTVQDQFDIKPQYTDFGLWYKNVDPNGKYAKEVHDALVEFGSTGTRPNEFKPAVDDLIRDLRERYNL